MFSPQRLLETLSGGGEGGEQLAQEGGSETALVPFSQTPLFMTSLGPLVSPLYPPISPLASSIPVQATLSPNKGICITVCNIMYHKGVYIVCII